MPALEDVRLHVATSLDDAVAVLAANGGDAVPMAGATWIMRAPLRAEALHPLYVALGRVADLRGVAVGEAEIAIGACVTHAELAAALAPLADCRGLAKAAGASANPAVRSVATVGGNLASADFAAADLVPALLAADAAVEIAGPSGRERMPLARYLEARAGLEAGRIVAKVIVPRAERRSAHARLPLRVAGDYPVAIVSLSVALGADGTIADARVAVGSVEPVARRWGALEAALAGQPLDAEAAGRLAAGCTDGFEGRDGVEASGAYRVRVLPALVRRAVAALKDPI
ncbi:carbon-monoxide dehydrogenase medium subunit [Amorphus suaedae]